MIDRSLPRQLVVVATFLILLGLLAICSVIFLAVIGKGQGTILALLGSATSIGAGWRLLRRVSGAWETALTLAGVGAATTMLAVLCILGSVKPMPIESTTILLPTSVAAAPFFLLFLMFVWSFIVLLRRGVRQLF